MKKLALTIAIIFGLGIGVYAQGGLFGYGAVSDEEYYGAGYNDPYRTDPLIMPGLPGHGQTDNQQAPLGGGALLLIGFGAAYAWKKSDGRCKK